MILKYLTTIALIILMIKGHGQETVTSEKFGQTLNVGIGNGYYGYIGHSIPVVHVDYEFDIASNWTLAPFLNFYSYESYHYWGNTYNPYKEYTYRQTVIPIGAKGTYYFDQFLKAGSKWDFYLAGSLGFAYRKTVWENDYDGNKDIDEGMGALFLDLHIGSEYHLNKRNGLFLDLSTGVSSFGLSVHF